MAGAFLPEREIARACIPDVSPQIDFIFTHWDSEILRCTINGKIAK